MDLNTGYASGGWGPGKFFKTTNGGNNWNLVINSGISFTDLHFLNKDTGWVCDDDNLAGIGLIKTTNGGINWVQQMDNTYQPKKLFFLNRDTGWVMSYNGKIYRTNNSGNNWISMYNFGSTSTLYNMFFTSSDTGWITQLGQNNSIMKTTNGGYNWLAQNDPLPSGSIAYGIYMINSNKGYIATLLNKILKTYNGVDWGKQDAPTGAYNSIYFVDSIHGRASHSYGESNIAATNDGGGPVMGVNLISSEVPNGFKLEQNYPNPFNSITNVKFQILNSGVIGITVYNISGRELTTLINKKLSPGTYEYRFDAGILSSGIYFYTLFADGKRVDTKKMILIK
jgi:photosystem II stability/assembly factor-like uncharacterized protein